MLYREISKIFREMSIELASRRPGGRIFPALINNKCRIAELIGAKENFKKQRFEKRDKWAML